MGVVRCSHFPCYQPQSIGDKPPEMHRRRALKIAMLSSWYYRADYLTDYLDKVNGEDAEISSRSELHFLTGEMPLSSKSSRKAGIHGSMI